MARIRNRFDARLFWGLLVLGIVLRGAVAYSTISVFDGPEYAGLHDIKAWVNSGGHILEGKNPYLESEYLDFSPLWPAVCSVLVAVAGKLQLGAAGASLVIKLLLTCVDVVVLLLLTRIALGMDRHPLLPMFLFFLNPVSIIITGYQGQFDNLSVLPVLWLLLLYMRWGPGMDPPVSSRRRSVLTGFLLGISWAVKHSSGPLVLFLKKSMKSWKLYLVSIAVAAAVFVIPFIPFASSEGLAQMQYDMLEYTHVRSAMTIWTNVWHLFGGEDAPSHALRPVWLIIMVLTAIYVQRKKNVGMPRIFAIYYLTILAFAPSYGRHYFIYPIILGSVCYPWPTAAVSLLAGAFLLSGSGFTGPLAIAEGLPGFLSTTVLATSANILLLLWWIWAVFVDRTDDDLYRRNRQTDPGSA